MAVQFKVPKSPSRDIDATDTFLGVDLTNTGVSMDIYRSPNAPNMVRDVPGKVRKRMGYYKEVLFGTETNVNFAAGTSAQEKEVFITVADINTDIKVYDLIQTIKSKDENAYTLYLEFDYMSEDEFTIFGMSVEASEDWTHFSDSIECASADEFTEVDVNSAVAQSIFIKNFSLMRAKDENYEWSPAPKYFVERETNDPIYGCHFLRNASRAYDGDRILNTNRALETGEEIHLENVSSRTLIAKLGEVPCNAQKLYLEFDVKSSAPAFFFIGGHQIGFVSTLADYYHYSDEITPDMDFSSPPTGFFPETRLMEVEAASDTIANLYIKNLSIMYEKDSDYEWSPAPEDNYEKFHIKDMYNIDPKELAKMESLDKDTATISSSEVVEEIELMEDPVFSPVYGKNYIYFSFDLTTSLENSEAVLSYVELEWKYKFRIETLETFFTDRVTENYKKQHFDLFRYFDNCYGLDKLKIKFLLSSGSSKAHISLSNIKIHTYQIRDSFLSSPKWFLYHVGKDFYLRPNESDRFSIVYSEANEHVSKSWQLNNNSYIIDGKDIYSFSIEESEKVEVIGQDNAFIPTVTIAKEPTGGGTSYEALNLLQPGFYELFQGKASVKKYQLSFDGLDKTECKAWLLDSNANWNLKVENTDFTVNRSTGEVTFLTAPGVSPITGEDNIKILAYRTVEGYRSRITKCLFGALFGVGGACDRLFLSGNPEHPNWDFYSQQYDPTYFPDTGYSVIGSEQSRIMGYAIVSNYLATFKDGFDRSQSVFIREGDILENEETGQSDPVFKLINTLQGEGVAASYSFGYLQTEPLFLTKAGAYAITEQDITGEKYAQNRSFYLDGVLRKEPNLDKAQAVIYDNQYVLSLNNKLFVLDGLQATRTDKSEPYATRQYAGFLCDDVPAVSIWADDTICFGTNDGKVCKFYTDEKALESYNDDGKAIYACWETPDLDDKLFYKNKTFRYLAVRLMQSLKTTAKMYSRKLGVWTKIYENMIISNPIDFENFDFNLFTFSIDTTEKLMHSKVRVKKVDKARFKIENGELNEPFGLSDLALEYIQSGNYKG